MEASKFYELERLLGEFQNHMEYNQDKMIQVGRTLEILKQEISDYEAEREEGIKQDVEKDNQK